MQLREIEYLLTIAETGTISGAAQKLLITQPSLSQFLNQYESELGAKLFVRTSHGVRPTAAGEVFLQDARQIRNLYHLSQEKLRDIADMKGGSVRLGISTFRAQSLLPPVLEHFYALYPGVSVQITELDSVRIEDALLEGSLDLGVVAFPLRKLRRDENIELLINDEVVIAAGRDHPVRRHMQRAEDGHAWVRVRDAARFPFLLGEPDTMLGRIARQTFASAHCTPEIRNDNLSASLALAMAEQGLGLCLTYASVRAARPGTDYLSIGREGIYLELALAFPPSGYRSAATQELARLMHEVLGGR